MSGSEKRRFIDQEDPNKHSYLKLENSDHQKAGTVSSSSAPGPSPDDVIAPQVRRTPKLTKATLDTNESTVSEEEKEIAIKALQDPSRASKFLQVSGSNAAQVIGVTLDKVVDPVVTKVFQVGRNFYRNVVKPFHLVEFFEAFYGLLLLFFGASLKKSLSAIEAYRIFGWNDTKKYLNILHNVYLEAKEAIKKDNQLDLDQDGIADVDEMDETARFTRRISIIFQATDPVELSGALTGIFQGFMAVVATLSTHFGSIVSIGTTIGDIFERIAAYFFHGLMYGAVTPKFHKWVPILSDYIFRVVGGGIVYLAGTKIVGAFYSSLRGADLLMDGFRHLLKHKNMMVEYHAGLEDGGKIHTAGMAVLATTGFLLQYLGSYVIIAPFSYILFPLILLEKLLNFVSS